MVRHTFHRTALPFRLPQGARAQRLRPPPGYGRRCATSKLARKPTVGSACRAEPTGKPSRRQAPDGRAEKQAKREFSQIDTIWFLKGTSHEATYPSTFS